ncbi:uncharacterized protein N7482_006825 [Penicillium canariense]|uniref:Uncharacterized protein n=1 Tax=Penicillium canariense TaxID=189055 RepID=A0A9W9HXY0_9EURO|nr:uncharacterized protein N7482_006825 [Penicillium canariense]KAJ5159821.1 hypothetical protein N7482_006825 [Penicillium canariense]
MAAFYPGSRGGGPPVPQTGVVPRYAPWPWPMAREIEIRDPTPGQNGRRAAGFRSAQVPTILRRTKHIVSHGSESVYNGEIGEDGEARGPPGGNLDVIARQQKRGQMELSPAVGIQQNIKWKREVCLGLLGIFMSREPVPEKDEEITRMYGVPRNKLVLPISSSPCLSGTNVFPGLSHPAGNRKETNEEAMQMDSH